MYVQIIRPILPDDPPLHLHMEPESTGDEDVLLTLVKAGCVCGYGANPEKIDLSVQHCQIPLTAIPVAVPLCHSCGGHSGDHSADCSLSVK